MDLLTGPGARVGPTASQGGPSVSRRGLLRLLGGAALLLAVPLVPSCSSAPVPPTAVPPTPVPMPTIALPTPTPVPQPTATAVAAPAAAAAAPTAAPTAVPTAVPTIAPTATTGIAALPKAEMTWLQVDYAPFVDISKKVIEEFKPRQPNVTVNLTTLPGDQYKTKQKLQATAGTPYDLSFVCCGDVAEYGELGLLLNLDDYAARDKMDPKMYFEGSFWEGLFDSKTKYVGSGNLLALPVNYVFEYVFYNKNMLKKASVKEPDYNWKWQDLLDMAQKLTLDKNGKVSTDAGFDPNNIAQFGHSMLWSGGEFSFMLSAGARYVTPDNKVTINTPEMIKAVTFMRDLIRKYHVMPSKTAGPDMPSFPSGKTIAMYTTGSWDYATFLKEIKDFEWGLVPFPIGPLGQRRAYGGSNQFASWKGVKSPDAAWEFLKWNSGPEMTLKYWGLQGIPSVKSAALNPDYPKIASLTPEVAKISAEAGTYMVPHDPTIRSTEWKKAAGAELDPIYEGKISPEEGCKNAQAKVEAILNRK